MFSISSMATLAAFLFLITLSGPETPTDLCPLVKDLNAVIEAATRLTPPPCPKIGFSDLPKGDTLRSQAGAYFPATGQIELAPDLDLTAPYGQSYLLHELVHAAQYASGVQHSVPCPAALEAEAYRVQADFLLDRGLPREAVMLRMLAGQLGQCGDAEY